MACPQFRLFTLNVRGIGSKLKRKHFFNLLRQNKYDVICLQESYVTKNVYDWKKEWGGEIVYKECTSHSGGLMVLFRKGFGASINVEYESERIIVVNIDLGQNMCALCMLMHQTIFVGLRDV
jgi:exonuclease III